MNIWSLTKRRYNLAKCSSDITGLKNWSEISFSLLPLGGIMSSFLMGCYDPDSRKWCTVTKCSGGYDDAMLARLQKELDVIKISKVRENPPGDRKLYIHLDCIMTIYICVCVCLCRTQVKSQAGWRSLRTIIQISLYVILRWDFLIQPIVLLLTTKLKSL